MVNYKISPILIYVILFLSISSFVYGEDWVVYGKNEYGTFHYDRDSMVRNKDKTISVIMKQVMSPDLYNTIEEVVPQLRGSRMLESRLRINCKSNEYKSEYGIYYDNLEKVVSDSRKPKRKYKKVDYRPIPDGTQIKTLRDEVCRYIGHIM